MKNFKKNSITAVAFVSLFTFTQCTPQNEEAAQPVQTVQPAASTLKVAYVNLDTLMSRYNLAQDINKEMMRKEEIEWLNAYHQKVRDELLPLLDDEADKAWLIENTKAI